MFNVGEKVWRVSEKDYVIFIKQSQESTTPMFVIEVKGEKTIDCPSNLKKTAHTLLTELGFEIYENEDEYNVGSLYRLIIEIDKEHDEVIYVGVNKENKEIYLAHFLRIDKDNDSKFDLGFAMTERMLEVTNQIMTEMEASNDNTSD